MGVDQTLKKVWDFQNYNTAQDGYSNEKYAVRCRFNLQRQSQTYL